MSLVRPELSAALHRWREVIAASIAGVAGLWFMSRGGYLVPVVGALIATAALIIGVAAWRRMRFVRPADGPGVVEIIEGQIGWYGPGIGGYVAIADLAEVTLVTVAGLRCWRLRQTDGQLLLIPIGASGASGLYDAFASLPGIDPAALTRALDATGQAEIPVWRRVARTALR